MHMQLNTFDPLCEARLKPQLVCSIYQVMLDINVKRGYLSLTSVYNAEMAMT